MFILRLIFNLFIFIIFCSSYIFPIISNSFASYGFVILVSIYFLTSNLPFEAKLISYKMYLHELTEKCWKNWKIQLQTQKILFPFIIFFKSEIFNFKILWNFFVYFHISRAWLVVYIPIRISSQSQSVL